MMGSITKRAVEYYYILEVITKRKNEKKKCKIEMVILYY